MEYNLEKTFDEIMALQNKALKFIDYLENEIC